MKTRNLFLIPFFLIAFLLGACTVKKTINYDRFGGGISSNKPVQKFSNKIAERMPVLASEKPSQKETEIMASQHQASDKHQQKIKTIMEEVPVFKVDLNKNKFVYAEINKTTHKPHVNEKPEILKQAEKVFGVAASMLLLGWFFQVLGSYVIFNVGSVLMGLGYILFGISVIMALTGWLNKLKKNKSSKKITFWHVLGGLFLLFLIILVIVLLGSSSGGMYSPF